MNLYAYGVLKGGGPVSTSSVRRRRALGSALVVVTALQVVVAAPAVATEACPSSIPGAGFKDLGGLSSETVGAINCVAYYGIVQGTSSTIYDPAGTVPRWQMALFLIRTAQDMGLALPGGTSGFVDLGGLSSETITAINQLAQLGITRGTSPTTFSPHDLVSRWQLALFITRLLARAGVSLPSGAHQGFTDLGGLSVEAVLAINQLRQLVIAKGTTPTTYTPYGIVFRWQMALFIRRSLNVGGVVPHTVSITIAKAAATTAESITATVTIRNADGSALRNRRVDVFVASGLRNDGTCNIDGDAHINTGDAGTGTNCVIDSGDPVTNNQGQVTVTLTHDNINELDTVWAWIGDNGQQFDNDVVPRTAKASAQITWSPSPAALDVTAEDLAKFGSTISVVAQFVDASDNPIPLAGQTVRFVVRRGGSTVVNQAVTTGTGGAAVLSYTGPPDPSAGSDNAQVTDTVTAFWDIDGDGNDDGAKELDGSVTVRWDDDQPADNSAVLSPDHSSGLVGAPRSVSAVVNDKFGQPVSGAEVEFQLSGAVADTQVRTTNSSGTATFSYDGPGSNGLVTIDARVDVSLDGDFGDPEDIGAGDVVDVTHYWVEEAGDLGGSTEFDIIAVSTASRFIDVLDLGGGQYLRLFWDSGDLFEVDGNNRTRSQFETALAALTLPKLDGTGKVGLITDPYEVGGQSAFDLRT